MSIYKRHPLSAIYEDLPSDEMVALVESIKKHGLLRPIMRYQGMILDGWQRFVACGIAKVMPRFEDYHLDDPAGYVEAANEHRRHETAGARSIVKTKINEWRTEGRHGLTGTNVPVKTNEQMAAEAGVSVRSIKDAKAVVQHGAVATEKAAVAGDISLRDAAEIAKTLPKKEQAAAVKAKKEKKPKPPKPETVPKSEYDTLAAAYAELQEKHQELLDELEAVELMRSDKMVGRYASLQEQLRTTERTRNDAMNQAVQLQKQTNWYLRELSKLGWKPNGQHHAPTA